ncbi:MAG TPA: DUF58 domain-containing protein, partial [Phototrophicaceae bacterium]|nr:DUF58 domain-containing protein [Phototrophicaceae bacterium]
ESIRRKFDQLMLVASRVRAGAIKGERRSIKRGTSIEFADYRNYAPGDDLRRLDWNVYARLDRPYIKLLEDEEDLAVHVVLDASASMDWGDETSPEYNKLLFGRRLFAGLGYISLVSNDRLRMSALSGGGLEQFGPVRGRGQSIALLKFAHQLKAGGVTDLNVALKDYASRAGRPGLCFIISDMFSPSGYLDGVNTLLGKGYEVILMHVLSPDEVTPPLNGDLRLVDIETGLAQEVSVDSTMREMYIRRLEGWRDDIRAECVKRGVHYLPLVTDVSWEKVILYDLRRLGVVK